MGTPWDFLQLQRSSFGRNVLKTQQKKTRCQENLGLVWLWRIQKTLLCSPERGQGGEHTHFLMVGTPANFLISCVMPSNRWPLQGRDEPQHLIIIHSRSTEANLYFCLCHLFGSCNLLLALRGPCLLPGWYFSFSKFQGTLPRFRYSRI